MSKEQTPITVEEKSLAYYAKNCADELIKTPISVLRYISELEQKVADNEQYAQTKVLKREKYLKNMLFRAYCKPFTNDENKIEQGMAIALLERFDKYYETEVKPKYE